MERLTDRYEQETREKALYKNSVGAWFHTLKYVRWLEKYCDELEKNPMKWLSIEKDGYPEYGMRVLTFSKAYRDKPEIAFRLLDSQFVPMCGEVTHWRYCVSPSLKASKEAGDEN